MEEDGRRARVKGVSKQTTTYYKVDDVVQWGGSTFVCNTAHTSQSDLYDDTSKWTSFVPGFNWTGTYSSGTAYKVNDLAKYGANVYICTVEHTAALLLTQLNLMYLFLD